MLKSHGGSVASNFEASSPGGTLERRWPSRSLVSRVMLEQNAVGSVVFVDPRPEQLDDVAAWLLDGHRVRLADCRGSALCALAEELAQRELLHAAGALGWLCIEDAAGRRGEDCDILIFAPGPGLAGECTVEPTLARMLRFLWRLRSHGRVIVCGEGALADSYASALRDLARWSERHDIRITTWNRHSEPLPLDAAHGRAGNLER